MPTHVETGTRSNHYQGGKHYSNDVTGAERGGSPSLEGTSAGNRRGSEKFPCYEPHATPTVRATCFGGPRAHAIGAPNLYLRLGLGSTGLSARIHPRGFSTPPFPYAHAVGVYNSRYKAQISYGTYTRQAVVKGNNTLGRRKGASYTSLNSVSGSISRAANG